MRFENAAKNAGTTILTRIIEQVLAFIARTVFIYFLSVEYLGITSLFSEVLNVLNMAELGIGTAINVALYAPLATGDKEKVKSLMRLYKKAYFYIGLVVLGLGIVLIPFLPYLTKGSTDLVNIRIVFVIYLAKSVLSYWLLAYKRSLLEADQKSYMVSLITYSVICIWKVFQILLLFLLKDTPELSFYVYCAGDALCSVITNLIISRIVDKQYSYIEEKNVESISKEEKTALLKNVYGVGLYKISSTVNSSADSIIISSFIGTLTLGLFSNYLLIAKAIITIINMAFTSITATIGNLNALETVEKKRFVFNTLHLAALWINGFCIICLWVLLNPFISGIWLGAEYELSELVVFTMCMNYLVDGIMEAPIRFRNACGLYWQSRYRAVATVVVNVILSILAVTVFDLGIPGVLLATIVSRLTITLIIDTKIVHKYVLECSPKGYFAKYFLSLGLVIATGGMLKSICFLLPESGLLFFVARMLLCIIFPNVVWWLIFRKTPEFNYIVKAGKNMVRRTISRGK